MKKIILLILLFPLLSFSAVYYMDATNGDNGKDGLSEANAWQTIAYLQTQVLAADDSILFKRGEIWREQYTIQYSGTSGNLIYHGSYGSGVNPIIDGSELLDGNVNISGDAYYFILSTQTNLVVFDGTIGTEVADSSVVNSEKEWYSGGDAAGDTLWFYAADTTDIYYAQRDYCIDDNNQNYITVKNLTIQNSNGSGIYSDGQNNIFDNLTVRRHPTSGIDINDHDVTISNSTFTYSFLNIDAAGGNNTIVENNEASLSITMSDNVGLRLGGTGNIARYNWVHDLDNGGDDGIYAPASGCSVYYNIVSNVGDNGIDIYAADNAFILNNSVYGAGDKGLSLAGGNVGNTIRNNILDGANADLNVAAAADSNNVGSNNIFVNDAGASGSGEYTGTNDLAATDPLFTDAANDDFTLLSTSPAIDDGFTWGQIRDYSGNLKSGSLWDIGAYEFSLIEVKGFDGFEWWDRFQR